MNSQTNNAWIDKGWKDKWFPFLTRLDPTLSINVLLTFLFNRSDALKDRMTSFFMKRSVSHEHKKRSLLLKGKHTSEANRLTMKDAEYLHPLTQDEKTTVRLPTDEPILLYQSSAHLIYMQFFQSNNLHLILHQQIVSQISSDLLAPIKHLYDDYTILALFEHNENITVLPSFWKHSKPLFIDQLTYLAVDDA